MSGLLTLLFNGGSSGRVKPLVKDYAGSVKDYVVKKGEELLSADDPERVDFPITLPGILAEATLPKGDKELPENFPNLKENQDSFKVGLRKGALSTATHSTNIGEKLLSSATRGIGHITGIESLKNSKPTLASNLIPESDRKPEDAWESAGFITEQVGEFIALSQLTAPGLSSMGSNIAGKGFFAAPLMGSSAKALTTGLLSGGLSYGQTEDTDEAKRTAIASGAFSFLGDFVSWSSDKVAKFLKEKVAKSSINQAIKPKAKHLRFGKDPAKAIIDEKTFGATKEKMFKNVTKKLSELDDQYDDIVYGVSGTRDVTDDVLGPLDDAIDDALQSGDDALVKRLQKLKSSFEYTRKLDANGKIINDAPKSFDLSAHQINDLRKHVGDSIKWRGDIFDNDVNAVKVKIYHGLRNQLDDLAPGSKKMLSRVSDLLSAKGALKDTIIREQSHNWFSLTDWLALVGGAAGGASQGTVGGAAVGAGGLWALKNVIESTPGLTSIAAGSAAISKVVAEKGKAAGGAVSGQAPTLGAIANIINRTLGLEEEQKQRNENEKEEKISNEIQAFLNKSGGDSLDAEEFVLERYGALTPDLFEKRVKRTAEKLENRIPLNEKDVMPFVTQILLPETEKGVVTAQIRPILTRPEKEKVKNFSEKINSGEKPNLDDTLDIYFLAQKRGVKGAFNMTVEDLSKMMVEMASR